MPGEINLTCDAWQADNTDAYFAVTGHWIEERTPGVWSLEHALLGFAQMNCSHSGAHLGQMLYKIVNRLHIVHKVRTPFSSRCFAHLYLKYRSVMLLVIMRRTTRRCCKNSRAAISSRLGCLSMSNAGRSGGYWHIVLTLCTHHFL